MIGEPFPKVIHEPEGDRLPGFVFGFEFMDFLNELIVLMHMLLQ
jgi:hypothetical protein